MQFLEKREPRGNQSEGATQPGTNLKRTKNSFSHPAVEKALITKPPTNPIANS